MTTKEQEEKHLTIARLNLLEDTCKFFNTDNRCVQEGGFACLYYREGYAGCAIGRLIEDKELCKRLDLFKKNAVTYEETFNMLPNEVKYFGKDFLSELQYLHDNGNYWDDKGLTISGERQASYIRRSFNLYIVT